MIVTVGWEILTLKIICVKNVHVDTFSRFCSILDISASCHTRMPKHCKLFFFKLPWTAVVCTATDLQQQAAHNSVNYGRWLKSLRVKSVHKWHSYMLETQLMIWAWSLVHTNVARVTQKKRLVYSPYSTQKHCGGEPEQTDTGTVLYHWCNTSSQGSSYMHIHSQHIYMIINSARREDKCLMHMPVVSPARAAVALCIESMSNS